MNVKTADSSYTPSRSRSTGAQVLHGLVAAEQVEERAQGLAALAFEVGVAFEDEAGVIMGNRDQPFVNREIREAQGWEAALPGAQDFAGAAQPQVFLGDAKPVLGLAQDGEAPLRDIAERRLIQQ